MDIKICIIGGGVVGLAIAHELSKYHEGVFLLERHKKFGQEISSRNSEVIHSGIYYPKGSLKAGLCVSGRKKLYEYCRKNDVLHKKCGKFIVATDNTEARQLKGILVQASKNGVASGKNIPLDELRHEEPFIQAIDALYFPESGIVDSHGLMKSLEKNAQLNGAEFAYSSNVTGIEKIDGGYEIKVGEESGLFTFSTECLINAAGLNSFNISQLAGINDPYYRLYFWKGEYWAVGNGKNKYINHLIYPVPEPNTTDLGIHATVDFNGGLTLGPNAVFINNQPPEYSVDKSRKNDFYESACRYMPFLEPDDLHPNQAGVRPKLQKPGDPARDFIIRNEEDRGFPNFVNLIGMESPGLTSCIAIGEYVSDLLRIE